MTKVSRRALLAAIAAAPFVRGAGAQGAPWPTCPVQVMVPYPPAWSLPPCAAMNMATADRQ